MTWLVAGLAILGGAVGLGQLAKRRLAAGNPPPGRLVDVGGYRLHVDCRGEGEPAVVFEAGLGDVGITWAAVQPAVAAFTRTCSYDRAGLGWSDPSPRRRTAATMVDELRALLAATEVAPPYVLVAQSIGALPARLFAARYPDDVAGLVLVDPAHEDQIVRAPEAVQVLWRRMARMVTPTLSVPRALAAAGLFALRPSMTPIAAMGAVPEAVGERRLKALVAARGGTYTAALMGEMHAADESRDQVRAERASLGDRPVIVLSAGVPAPLPAKVPEDAQRANAALWRELHEEVAATSTRGRVIVVEGAGHMIHHERPDLVIEAVREVVEAVRADMRGGQ